MRDMIAHPEILVGYLVAISFVVFGYFALFHGQALRDRTLKLLDHAPNWYAAPNKAYLSSSFALFMHRATGLIAIVVGGIVIWV